MSLCADCGQENIPGADVCEMCGQPMASSIREKPHLPVEESLLRETISNLPIRVAVEVSPTDTVKSVLKQMVDHSTGCAVVVNDGRVIGIFSERDVLMRLNSQFEELSGHIVGEFMTPAPETLELKDKIAFALHKMDAGSYRHIPVLRKGELCGIISVREILHYLTQQLHPTS